MRFADALIQDYQSADKEVTRLIGELAAAVIRRTQAAQGLLKLGYTPTAACRAPGVGLDQWKKAPAGASSWRDGLPHRR